MGRRATNKEHKFADGCEMVSTREEFTPTLERNCGMFFENNIFRGSSMVERLAV